MKRERDDVCPSYCWVEFWDSLGSRLICNLKRRETGRSVLPFPTAGSTKLFSEVF